jgi:tripartite-type tricarboxylate transporter receptor subunit TctC
MQKIIRIKMRRLIVAIFVSLVVIDAMAQSGRDAFPVRPIRIIVPYVAGGSATLVARFIGNRLSENLGQSVIIDNRGGGSGKIGAEAVAKATPDGYTLLFGETGSMAINVWLMDRTGSHPIKDFAAVGQVVTLENVLVTHPSFGVKNLRELVSKGASGPLIYGSSGTGTVGHLAMELLKKTLNIKVTHVPYKGGSQAVADLMGGQIPMLVVTVPTAAPYVLSGRFVALSALSQHRTAILPDRTDRRRTRVPRVFSEPVVWFLRACRHAEKTGFLSEYRNSQGRKCARGAQSARYHGQRNCRDDA